MAYIIDTCGVDRTSDVRIYYRIVYEYREAPFPETLEDSAVLGPDFRNFDTNVILEWLTISGVETSSSKWGFFTDFDEGIKWDGDPTGQGDWLGMDYYKASVDTVYVEPPDAYRTWLDTGEWTVDDSNRATFGWGSVVATPEQFDAIVAGAYIVNICPDPVDPGDDIDLKTAPKDVLDRITEADIIQDYIDTVAIDEPSLLDRGWDIVRGTLDDVRGVFSPDYGIDETALDAGDYETLAWETVDADAVTDRSGTGLTDLWDRVSDAATSSVLDLIKSELERRGYTRMAEFFETAGAVKEFSDDWNSRVIDPGLRIIDGFADADGTLHEFRDLEEMERDVDALRDSIFDIAAERVPIIGEIVRAIGLAGRHSDFGYEVSGNAGLRAGDSHSNRVLLGDGGGAFDGAAGDDFLFGGAGRDRLSGGDNDDWLAGGRGNDRLAGDAGRDQISGGAGRDRLLGGTGDDRIDGGDGDDFVVGGGGRDVLRGGRGEDRLKGGSGADIFVFGATDRLNTIIDFAPGIRGERIDLSAVGAITGVRDLQRNHLSDVDGIAVIQTAKLMILLDGITSTELDSSHFLF